MTKSDLLEKIEDALSTIKNLNFTTLKCGKYVVNDDFFYLVQEYETKSSKEADFEAHKKYVDIQYLIEGQERIEVTATAFLDIKTPYDAEKAVVFLKEPNYVGSIELTAGSYAIFYPKDAHKPGIILNKSQYVKKIIGKIRI